MAVGRSVSQARESGAFDLSSSLPFAFFPLTITTSLTSFLTSSPDRTPPHHGQKTLQRCCSVLFLPFFDDFHRSSERVLDSSPSSSSDRPSYARTRSGRKDQQTQPIRSQGSFRRGYQKGKSRFFDLYEGGLEGRRKEGDELGSFAPPSFASTLLLVCLPESLV